MLSKLFIPKSENEENENNNGNNNEKKNGNNGRLFGKKNGNNNNQKNNGYELPKADTIDLVPVAAICDPFIVTKDGSFVQMFEIPPLESAVSTSEQGGERAFWYKQYGEALAALPPGTKLQLSILMEPCDPTPDLQYFMGHKKHWYMEGRDIQKSESERQTADALCCASDLMLQSVTDWFEKKRPVTMKSIISISYRPPNVVDVAKSAFSFNKKNSKKSTLNMADLHQQLPTAKEHLHEQSSIIMAAFGNAQIPLVPLNYQEMCQVVWRAMHPISSWSSEGSAVIRAELLASGADMSQIGPPATEKFSPDLSSEEIGELLAPDTVIEEPEHIVVDDVYMTGFVINDFKPNKVAGVHVLSGLQGGWSGTMFIEVAEPHEVADKLRQREVQISATEGAKASKGIIQNFHSLQERNAVQNTRYGLETASITPIYIRFLIRRSAPDLETLRNYRRATESALKTSDIDYFVAHRGQEYLYLSCVPTDRLYLNQKPRNMDASSLSPFFWPRRVRSQEEGGIYVGIDRNTDLPVRVDPFGVGLDKTPTYLILGRPGAGKSVLLRTEMVAALMDGGNVRAIDLEGEMEDFTNYYGGKYIRVGSSAPDADKINVLDIPPDIEDPLAAGTEHLVSFVSSVIGSPIKHGQQWNALASAYAAVIKNRGWMDESYKITEWHSEDAPLLSDIVRVLERQQHDNGVGMSLATMLDPYANGVYAKQFNNHTTFDINNEKLVVFNLKDVNESNSIDRMRVYLWQVMGWIWGEVLRRHAIEPDVPNHIMIDEVWKLLSAPGGAAAIENMARRSRKRRASLWMATQESSEFITSEEGVKIMSIIGNKFIMAQEPMEAERLRQILKLSSGVTDYITSLKTGSGLLITPDNMHNIYVAVPEGWRAYTNV